MDTFKRASHGFPIRLRSAEIERPMSRMITRRTLSSEEYEDMMRDFQQASDWMGEQLASKRANRPSDVPSGLSNHSDSQRLLAESRKVIRHGNE